MGPVEVPIDGPINVHGKEPRALMATGSDGDGQRPRWLSGVIPYKEMGYWKPDYEPRDSDILVAFRLTPQPQNRTSIRLRFTCGSSCAPC